MTPQDEAHIKALEEENRNLRTALSALLKEHDILSGNFDVMDPKHVKPDRWPTAASLARAALKGAQSWQP